MSRFFVLVALVATGCANKALVRVAPPGAEPSSAPKIRGAWDLGALPLPGEGSTLSTEASDGWLTPGEYVALVGDDLGLHPKVTIANQPTPVVGWLEGGSLLVRVPRGVPPGRWTLFLETPAGRTFYNFNVNSYVWGADARGDSLRIRRLSDDETTLDDKGLDLAFSKARYTALAPEGGVLFALQEPDYDSAFMPEVIESAVDAVTEMANAPATVELAAVHMGAKNAPFKLTPLPIELQSRPTGLAAGPDGLVLVLESRHITVVDASNPAAPKVVSRLEVATGDGPRELADAEFLKVGRQAVVLEAYENRVSLIDLTDPAAPRITSSLQLADTHGDPFSIDLAPVPGGKSVLVLQGPNLRIAGQKLRDAAKTGWDRAKVGFKKAPDETEAPTAVDSLARVVEVGLTDEGALALKKSMALPKDVFPFFVTSDPKGTIYVSALHGQNPFANLKAEAKVVLTLLEGLRDTAQFSRVIAIDPKTGEATTVLQSMAIYYEVVPLPSGRICASLTRLGPGILPPRITLDWGFEIVDGKFVKVREVANTSFKLMQAITRLLPPYRYERIGAQ